MTDITGGVSGYTGRSNVGNYGVVIDNEDKGVTVDNFLNLMVAQLQNQDFMNPVDDTQYVSQLAQFSTMQSMQEMSGYMKTNYVLSLIGQEVTAAKYSVSGALDTETGPITKISLADNKFLVYVNDKSYTLEQIMQYHSTGSQTSGTGDTGGTGSGGDTESAGSGDSDDDIIINNGNNNTSGSGSADSTDDIDPDPTEDIDPDQPGGGDQIPDEGDPES